MENKQLTVEFQESCIKELEDKNKEGMEKQNKLQTMIQVGQDYGFRGCLDSGRLTSVPAVFLVKETVYHLYCTRKLKSHVRRLCNFLAHKRHKNSVD